MIRIIICFAVCIWIRVNASAVEMTAGVAKSTITSDQSLVMVNGRLSQGTLKDIHARALVLNDGQNRLVFVTYDLNCLDVATPLLRKRVASELGIPKSHLILLATHNHSAPIQIVPDNFEYGHWLADRLFELIQQAIAAERGPVKVEFGVGSGYFVYSRGNAPADYEIQMLKVSQADQPVAILFNHPTHPVQASLNTFVEPGHPGWAMDEIEAALPGVQAMYCDAAGGNQFVRKPLDYESRMREARNDSRGVDAYMQQLAKETARQLAQAALEIAQGELTDVTGPITSSYEIFALPLAPPIPEIEARRMAENVPMDVGFVAYPHKDRSTNWIRMLIRYYDEGLEFPKLTTEMVCTDDTYLIRKDDERFLEKYDSSIDDSLPCVYEETIVAKIGDMPLVAMQGEVCAPIGARIKDEFRASGPIFVTAYMGEHNLYIPTRELVRQDAYQAQVIRIQYACPVGWDPSVEDVMVSEVVRMVTAALGQEGSKRPIAN